MVEVANLNHGGTDPDNPILDGIHLTIKIHKDSSVSFRQGWVQVEDSVYMTLTPTLETDSEITFDITAGTELQADSPAIKNTIHFTFSDHSHVKKVLYVASRPAALITLDGYNGSDPQSPLIWPMYPAEVTS